MKEKTTIVIQIINYTQINKLSLTINASPIDNLSKVLQLWVCRVSIDQENSRL